MSRETTADPRAQDQDDDSAFVLQGSVVKLHFHCEFFRTVFFAVCCTEMTLEEDDDDGLQYEEVPTEFEG